MQIAKDSILSSITVLITKLSRLQLRSGVYNLSVFVLLLLLTGCGATNPQAMGAVHAAPAEASSAALSPGGWLGPVTSLDLYPVYTTDDAYVAIYTGYDGNTQPSVPVIGTTDGKREGDGWTAHGIYKFMPPDMPDDAIVSCAIGEFTAADEEFVTVYGRAAPEVGLIDAVPDDSGAISAARRDDLFVAVAPRNEVNDFTELTLFDTNGASLTTIQTTECQR